jgi:enoyl-CoA hydratase/carnithine racemase
MNSDFLSYSDDVAVVKLSRGKVNALNAQMVSELAACFEQLRSSRKARSVVLTGNGKFFSFGFDLPELLTYERPKLKRFLLDFTRLLTDLFLFPKPIIGALNGHTTAGGCMLATALDYRIMVEEKAKISLNEISIGVPVFSGPAAILQYVVGKRNAETVLFNGAMMEPGEAAGLGLVDSLVPVDQVLDSAIQKARQLGTKNPEAFAALKGMLRGPVVDAYSTTEEKSIDDWLDIWFTDEAQALLRKVEIRS